MRVAPAVSDCNNSISYDARPVLPADDEKASRTPLRGNGFLLAACQTPMTPGQYCQRMTNKRAALRGAESAFSLQRGNFI